MNNTLIHSRYEQIWNKFQSALFPELLERGFLFQYDQDETECDLLFVGINPAYSSGDRSYRASYPRPSENSPAYFKSFTSIAGDLASNYAWQGKWTHLDIFVFRETDQNFVENKLLKSDNGVAFLFEQLMVARDRILHIRPKAIIVSNALVRMFTGKERGFDRNGKEFGIWMDFSFQFDKAIGTDVIVKPAELKGTPVFFSSMLSGQRALDKGSKERLVWHIAKVLEN